VPPHNQQVSPCTPPLSPSIARARHRAADFTYANAEAWFANLDRLIHYANADGRVNAFYSTPAACVPPRRVAPSRWRRRRRRLRLCQGPPC